MMSNDQRIYASTQEAYLPLHDPSERMIHLDNGSFNAVIETGGMPLDMLSVPDQDAAIAARARLLSRVNHPIMEVVRSHRVRMQYHAEDVQRWMDNRDPGGNNLAVRTLGAEIQKYCAEFGRTRARADKHSYLVVPADTDALEEVVGFKRSRVRSKRPTAEQTARMREVAVEQLEIRCDEIIREITRKGDWASRLDTQELIDLAYMCWSSERAFEHPLHHSEHVGDGIERDAMALLVKGEELPDQTEEGIDGHRVVDLSFFQGAGGSSNSRWFNVPARLRLRAERKKREAAARREDARIRDLMAAARRTAMDDIAPSGTELTDHYFKVDGVYTRTLVIDHLPRRVNRDWLRPLLTLDDTVDLAIYIDPVEPHETLKHLQSRLGEIESSRRLNFQRGKSNDPELEIAYEDLERIQTAVQKGEEKVFKAGFYVTVRAETLKALNALTVRVENTVASMLAKCKRMTHRHDLGFLSTLPQHNDLLNIRIMVDLSTLALAPVARLSSPGHPRGVINGVMMGAGTPVLIDTFDPEQENFNQAVIATSGGGKSYKTKTNLAYGWLAGYDVCVVDPENEYGELVRYLGGTEIVIGPHSHDQINIFDLPDGVDPRLDANLVVVRERALALLGLVEIIVGRPLTANEIAVSDAAVFKAYQTTFDAFDADPEERSEPLPTLADYIVALRGGGIVGEELASILAVYDTGSLGGILSGHTNVDLDATLLSYNTHQITDGRQQALAVYLFTSYIWTRARLKKNNLMVVLDEGWWIFRFPRAAEWVNALFRRARKYRLSVTLIVQEANDLLQNIYGQACFKNASVKVLLKQDSSNIPTIKENLPEVTESDVAFLVGAVPGEAIIFRKGRKSRVKIEAAGPVMHRLASTRGIVEDEEEVEQNAA